MPIKPRGALYLQRDKFQIYIPGFPQVLEVRFPIEVVSEMEIVNQDLFVNLIKTFVTNTKLPPCNLIIVIADNASFLKDIFQPKVQVPSELLSKEELEKKAKEFFSLVPFEEVASKIVLLKNGVRAYATNRDLYEVVKRAFETLGFEISAVIPAMAFGAEVNTKPTMDGAVAGVIISRADSLMKEYNLLTLPLLLLEPEKEESETTEGVGESVKPKNRLPLLLGLFGFLLVVLAIVSYMQFQPAPAKPKPSPSPAAGRRVSVTAPPKITTIVSPTISEAETFSVAKTLTVEVINVSSSATQALALREALTKLEFKSVNLKAQPNAGAAQTSVTFSGKVSQAIKDAVLEEVQKFSSVENVTTRTSAVTDVTILLAQ